MAGHASLAPASGRIRAIESLRGLAALAILAYHAGYQSGIVLTDAKLAPIAIRLDVGVTIFFLLSGFLLYRPFVRSRVLGTRAPWIERYVASRILRIVPAYWVALAVITVWLGLEGVWTPKGVVTYFGFLQSYDADTWNQGLAQAWSLCVEAGFYIFLPFFALLLRRFKGATPGERLRTEWIGLAALFAAGWAWNAVVLSTHNPSDNSTAPLLYSFPAYIDLFAIGMAVAVLATAVEAEPNKERRWLARLDRFPVLGVLLAVIAFWLATRVGLDGGNGDGFQWGARHFLYGIVAVGLLLPAVFGRPEHGFVRRVMSTRIGSFFGDISYGIFLWNVAVITWLDREGAVVRGGATAKWMQWIFVVLLLTTAIATISWYGLEKPALRLRDRLTRRLTRKGREDRPTQAERETDIAAP
jgi:peptidoglycan/LPS O-acetylase OafA/YrhL